MAEKLTPEEAQSADRVNDLIECITQYEREFKKWEARTDKLIKRYRDDRGERGAQVRFNILWSNVQTLVPATFARLPRPDVSRRFRDNDPVGRVAALLLERGLDYEINQYPDYAASMKQCVLDRFLGGRGTAWARYEPHFKAMESGIAQDGEQVTEDVETREAAEPQEEIDYECAPIDYVHYKDFGHSVARTWEEVTKVWRIVYMNEDAVIERFGEDTTKSIPFDASPEKKDKANGGGVVHKQAKIYEIWDKEAGTAEWLSRSMGKVLDTREDPLKLNEFFPCPKPLFSTQTNETLVPVPDFVLYQDQADELDTLSSRIDGLIKALQVRGVCDAAVPELMRLFSEAGNTDLIPVKNFTAFAEKQGLKGSIDIVDLAPIAAALREAYSAMTQIKEYIYEIMGVADIIRGQSEAQETLGAQQIKQNFAGLRLKTMRDDVAKFAGDLLRLKAQIICGKYSPLTIAKISAADQLSESDKQIIPQAVALLTGEERMANPEASGPNPLRSFRIDVEADSLVRMDEQQEKSDRMEFLKASGAFLREAFPIIQQSPQAAPLLVQMLKFGVTGFKVGKTIEGDFDQVLDQLKQQALQPQQPKPDPDLMKIQAQAQAKQMEMQQSAQFKAQDAQLEIQKENAKQQAQAQEVMQQNQLEAQRAELDRQHELRLEQMRMMFEEQQQKSQQAMELLIERLTNATKIEVAETAAQATLTAQQEAAARQSSQP